MTLPVDELIAVSDSTIVDVGEAVTLGIVKKEEVILGEASSVTVTLTGPVKGVKVTLELAANEGVTVLLPLGIAIGEGVRVGERVREGVGVFDVDGAGPIARMQLFEVSETRSVPAELNARPLGDENFALVPVPSTRPAAC